MGACILDIDNPAIVKYRCNNFILTPETWYEERGFVANVVFPCAALTDAATGRIAIYYGAADSYVGMAFTTVDEIVNFVKANDAATADDKNNGIM
jgi:beta-1,4-mannooligosaccharide/beta-1,4-mannosyl-N-acetylglucosamine phosphorylase